MDYPCNNCYSHSTDCQKTCGAYLAYLRQLSVEAEIEQLESKLNKPILTTYTTTTLSPKNEPKRIMPLQVKESDFKGDESHYYYNKNNFSFHIFIKPDNGFSLFYKHIKIFDEDVKQITLSEAVTAINNYLKQLYEEVQKWKSKQGKA